MILGKNHVLMFLKCRFLNFMTPWFYHGLSQINIELFPYVTCHGIPSKKKRQYFLYFEHILDHFVFSNMLYINHRKQICFLFLIIITTSSCDLIIRIDIFHLLTVSMFCSRPIIYNDYSNPFTCYFTIWWETWRPWLPWPYIDVIQI